MVAHHYSKGARAMTIAELIAKLQELAEDHGDDTEVVVVHQQSYPLRELVQGVAAPKEPTPTELEDIIAYNGGNLELEEAEGIWYDDEGPHEVTLVLGGAPDRGSPYGDRGVWDRI